MSSIDLIRTDFANLRRDPMLAAVVVAPLLVAALVMCGFDPLAAAVVGFVELDRRLVVAAALLLVPLLIGFVVGFLLVEEHEERILDAVAVTPLGASGFLKHRLLLPAVVGAVAAGFLGAVMGDISLPALLAVAVLGGATACLVTMTMVAIARDRVQALAVSKLTGFLLVAAVAFQFADGVWRIPLGLVPATWLVDVAVSPTVWPPFLFGVVTHAAAGLVLWRRLQRRML